MADEKVRIIVEGVDKASGILRGIGDVAKTAIGVAIGNVIVPAFKALTGEIGSFITEAMAAEDIEAQLNAVLKSTGGIAGVTADMAVKLADSLSRVTRFEDDAIISGENLLLTFTGIGKDVFPQATETMLNMSQALGQDLKSSAIQLGKALQDPVLGVTALRRVGVNFNEAQVDMIKSMVEAGDVMGAQKFILAELENEFGGAARAAGDTFAGKLDILKNQFGNIKETIGGAIIPILTQLADKLIDTLARPEVQAAIQSVVTWLAEKLPVAIQAAGTFLTTVLWPAMQTVMAFVRDSLIPALRDVWAFIQGNLVPIFQTVAGWFSGEGQSSIGGFADKIRAVLGPVIEFMQERFGWIVDWVKENWPLIQETIQVVMAAIKAAIETVLAAVRAFWEEHGETIMAYIGNMWDIIKTIFDTALKTIFDLVKGVMQLITGDTEGFKVTMEGIWTRIKEAGETIFAALKENLLILWRGLLSAITGAWDSFKDWLARTGENIVEGIRNGVQNAWDSFKDWFKGKIQDLIDSILGALGIHSPSKVFAGIGLNMTAGLKAGLLQGMDDVRRTMSGQMWTIGGAQAGEVAAGVSGGRWAPGTRCNGGITIINNYGAGSVRSDDDIDRITREQEMMLIRRGVRSFAV